MHPNLRQHIQHLRLCGVFLVSRSWVYELSCSGSFCCSDAWTPQYWNMTPLKNRQVDFFHHPKIIISKCLRSASNLRNFVALRHIQRNTKLSPWITYTITARHGNTLDEGLWDCWLSVPSGFCPHFSGIVSTKEAGIKERLLHTYILLPFYIQCFQTIYYLNISKYVELYPYLK